MKTRGWKWMAAFLLMVGGTAVMAQDTEVPGDNFSLEGALELFKKSKSPEEFEKMLNSEDSKVNNLDLNGDGYIDYIRVIDRNESNIHTFTMQAVISDNEVQDIAVIALEKKANGKAVLQIIGDEDVYGMETIIEPTQEVRVNAGTTTTTTVVNVWAWPSVQYVYSPSYVVWVSPWSWSMRPVWWYGWHPVVYYRYDSWWRPYRPYYARCYSPRIAYAHRIYHPHRVTSGTVYRRHESQITRYRTANRSEYDRSRTRYNNDNRYSNNGRDRQRDVRAGQPTRMRNRSNDEASTRGRTETRPSRSADWSNERRTTDRNNNAVQRDRSGSQDRQRTAEPRTERSVERNTPVQRERSISRPAERGNNVDRQRSQPQRERVSSSPGRSSQPRMSGGDRSGGSKSSGSRSSSRGGNKRS